MLGLALLIRCSLQWTFPSPHSNPSCQSFREKPRWIKYVWPCQREKDYCISNQLKCVGWAAEHRLSRSPAFYKSAELQRAVEQRTFKILNTERNFFGNEIPVRLATSEILPSLTTQGYNITGLHVIDVRSLLQGLRSSRLSSSSTEDSFEESYLEPLFFEMIGLLFSFSFLWSPGCSFAFLPSTDSCPYTYR